MKKILAVFAAVTVLFSTAPLMRSQDVSVNFFYDNLNSGSWFEVGNYGYCWQPDVAVNDSSWRPYADGYWAYTDDGWTWVSYEDFGWATYHYGRWVRLADYGWVWKPGYEWGPAWVSWRTGGNYIGWAPLPPETEYVYESRPLTGHLDVEYDIGPAYYNFCDVRYIGEPVLRSRLVPYQQNVTYITQTVNVTNITYKNKTVYNYGPDVNVVNQYSSRPIQRLKLERQTNVDVSSAAKSGGLTKVQGNALLVAAPTRLNKPAKEIAPPTVKTKVAQPRIEKGWAEVGDANAQTQLKEKIKTQDLNKVPPFTTGAAATASRAPSTASVAGASPFEKGKGKNKNKPAEQAQMGNPPASDMSSGMRPGMPEGGKKKGKHAGQDQLGAMTSASPETGAEMSPGGMPDSGKPGKGKNRRNEQFGAAPSPAGQTPEAMTAPETKRKEKGKSFGAPAGGTTPQSVSDEPTTDDGVKKKIPGRQPPPGPPLNSRSGAPGAPSPTDAAAPEMKQKEKGKNFGRPAGGTTPQSVSDQPTSDDSIKKKIPNRQPPGPPPNSRTGAAGGPSTTEMGPQGLPAGGVEGPGKHKVEPSNPSGVVRPTGSNQPAGEHRHEGKKKAGESPAPSPQ